MRIRSFFRAFCYAGRGLRYCLHGRNFRFHCLAAVLLAVLLAFGRFGFSRSEVALLVLCATLVLAAEAFNTALETVVDLVCPTQNPLAGKAKDLAAAAVLLCAMGSVLVAALLVLL